MTERVAAQVAADLRQMAESLWEVEFRIDVDRDAALLLAAISIRATESTARIGRDANSPWMRSMRSARKLNCCAGSDHMHDAHLPDLWRARWPTGL